MHTTTDIKQTADMNSLKLETKQMFASNKHSSEKQQSIIQALIEKNEAMHQQSSNQMNDLSSQMSKSMNEIVQQAINRNIDWNARHEQTVISLQATNDQQIQHLQKSISNLEKYTQTERNTIVDNINDNSKTQVEFENCFKIFIAKFRDNIHQNLNTVQETLHNEISYLDQVLRAEVKTRIKCMFVF